MLPCLSRSVLLALLLATVSARAEAPLCGRPYDPAERVAHRVRGAATPPDFSRPTTAAEPIGAVRRVHVADGRKLVALTFDLCETEGEIAGYDGGVVGVLRREGVAATFFSGGHWAATHKARLGELMADATFEVGNHTWSHANLRTVSAERRALEIGAAQATLTAAATAPLCAATPPKPPAALFRFPFGACDAASLSAVRAAGLTPIQWDISSGDPSPQQSAAAIVHTVLAQVRPGSIVLMHANGRGWHTAEALPALIAGLRARGYTPVTVSDLLAAGTPEITPTCYDSHPGDTDRYDRWPRVLSNAAPERPKAVPVRLP